MILGASENEPKVRKALFLRRNFVAGEKAIEKYVETAKMHVKVKRMEKKAQGRNFGIKRIKF